MPVILDLLILAGFVIGVFVISYTVFKPRSVGGSSDISNSNELVVDIETPISMDNTDFAAPSDIEPSLLREIFDHIGSFFDTSGVINKVE